MITGLRTQGTSLQNYFKIKADISIFGKTFGGGLPLGIICISKKIENKINKQKQKIFFGGTFSGNSFVSYVGLSVFNYIQKNKSKIFNRLDKLSFKFESELNTFFISKKLDLKIYRFGSLMRIIFTNRNINNRIQRDFFEQKKFKDILNFKKFLYENNIYYSSSGLIFFSYSTTEQNVNYIIKVFKEGCLKHFVKKNEIFFQFIQLIYYKMIYKYIALISSPSQLICLNELLYKKNLDTLIIVGYPSQSSIDTINLISEKLPYIKNKKIYYLSKIISEKKIFINLKIIKIIIFF